MCCCNDDDYDTPEAPRPQNERPHPPVSQPRAQRQAVPPQRGLSREETERKEKRERQAQATAAARNYGWPTPREVGFASQRTPGNRDSVIEPHLASGLAALPGSDFRAVYDPQRLRQSPRQSPQQQPRQLPPQRPNHMRPDPPRPIQQPSYHRQRPVTQQPVRMPPMRAVPLQNMRPASSSAVHQRPSIARTATVQPAARAYVQPQTARLVRRDSNGISECSDDDDDYRLEELRKYTVSPPLSP
ncbi:hypothetical protein F5Y10DRAFT_289349 [Nemania abortiva]|nr:hypothetical protein F5Y10DRAFT_289349 [Nemania abortiva]